MPLRGNRIDSSEDESFDQLDEESEWSGAESDGSDNRDSHDSESEQECSPEDEAESSPENRVRGRGTFYYGKVDKKGNIPTFKWRKENQPTGQTRSHNVIRDGHSCLTPKARELGDDPEPLKI